MSQMELNMGAGAMSAAVEAAVRAVGTGSIDEATRAEAATKAAALLRDEDAEGMSHLRNLTLSMGLPAARACLRQMVAQHGLRGAAKQAALEAIKEISPVTEKGCMKVDFFNVQTKKGDAAYLRLDQCPRHHDLAAQLDKLRPYVSPDKWGEVTKALSHLLLIGRSVYGSVARAHPELLRQIAGDGAAETYADYKIDPSNTTLYLQEDWPSRAGFYVSLEAEMTDTSRGE
jgi:hypothetical protein